MLFAPLFGRSFWNLLLISLRFRALEAEPKGLHCSGWYDLNPILSGDYGAATRWAQVFWIAMGMYLRLRILDYVADLEF